MAVLASLTLVIPEKYTVKGEVSDAVPASSGYVNPFADVRESDWFFRYLMPLAESGVFVGTSPTTFDPDMNLSAAQLFTLITRYLGVESEAIAVKNRLPAEIKNDASKWYYPYIVYLFEKGFLNSGEFDIHFDGTLKRFSVYSENLLTSPIKREDTAMYLARSFELENTDLVSLSPASGKDGHGFIRGGSYDEETAAMYSGDIADFEAISPEMVPYVLKCYYSGIFAGDEKGWFNPKDYLRRCEAAKLVAAIMYSDLRHPASHGAQAASVPVPDNAEAILDAYIGSFTFDRSGNLPYMNVTTSDVFSGKFACDVYISRYLYGANYKAYYLTDVSEKEFVPRSARVLLAYSSKPCEMTVLMTVRNRMSGEVEAFAEYRITTGLEIKKLSFEKRG